MKLIKIAVIAVVFLGFQNGVVYAQDAEVKDAKTEKKIKEKKDSGKIEKSGKGEGVVKYRRSSLHTMIIEDEKLPKKELLIKSFTVVD